MKYWVGYCRSLNNSKLCKVKFSLRLRLKTRERTIKCSKAHSVTFFSRFIDILSLFQFYCYFFLNKLAGITENEVKFAFIFLLAFIAKKSFRWRSASANCLIESSIIFRLAMCSYFPGTVLYFRHLSRSPFNQGFVP